MLDNATLFYVFSQRRSMYNIVEKKKKKMKKKTKKDSFAYLSFSAISSSCLSCSAIDLIIQQHLSQLFIHLFRLAPQHSHSGRACLFHGKGQRGSCEQGSIQVLNIETDKRVASFLFPLSLQLFSGESRTSVQQNGRSKNKKEQTVPYNLLRPPPVHSLIQQNMPHVVHSTEESL